MILSTQTSLLSQRLGEHDAIRLLASTGFDALDFSMFEMHQPGHPLNQPDYRSYLSAIRQTADACGLPFRQAHAPFPTYIDNQTDYNTVTRDRVIRSIEAASLLGAQHIVVHPVWFRQSTEQKERNLAIFNDLAEATRDFPIKICLENMWGHNEAGDRIIPNVCSTGRDFADYLDALDPQRFTACLDLGHCGLVGEDAATMIRQLDGHRLKALHVHDNNHLEDQHTAPFSGQMDWPSIMEALAGIGYDGDLTLEADNFMAHVPDDLLPSAIRYLHDCGRQLIRMFEQHL